MAADYGLTVRRHERHSIALDALLNVVAGGSGGPGAGLNAGTGAVRFSAESGVGEIGANARVVDLGAGGMGLSVSVFLPRGCMLRVRVLGAGGQISSPRLETMVRVQRVTMTDRRPTYLLGTSFADSTPSLQKKVAEILAEIAAQGGTVNTTEEAAA